MAQPSTLLRLVLPLLLGLGARGAEPTLRFQVPAAPAGLAVPPPDALRTPSGLATAVLRPGKGTAHPGPADAVMLEYTGWTAAGKVFDSTAGMEWPLCRPLDRFFKGMREGIGLMVPGEKRLLWIPPGLAAAPGLPPGPLVMEVELLSVDPDPLRVPEDLAGPPEGATLTRSGLAWRTLRPGQGTVHPARRNRVTVRYTGWTSDGRMFDTTWKERQETSLALSEVIQGWTEGLQLMVAGEKARFWIPKKLAYKGESGKPAGALVFDIELLDIF